MTTLMTGASGFLGQFILRDLLLRGRRMVVVLRPPLHEATHRLTGLLLGIGLDAAQYIADGRLVPVRGVLPDQLPEPEMDGIDELISCAASLQLFAGGNGEPFKTNVAGTEALIAWARRRGIRKIHAVSTAYVCGWRKDPAPEVFHDPRPEFQTEYEWSKWLAESALANWGRERGHGLTVFRPSFLVGDSNTGYTTQFGGFYQLARMVAIVKEQYRKGNNGELTYVPLRIPGRPDDFQNVVPVDFAAGMIAEIVSREALHGRIYHLTDPQPPSNDRFKQWLEEYFRMHGGFFVPPGEMTGERSAAEELLWEKFELMTPRLTQSPHFLHDNTNAVMRSLGIAYPAMNRERVFKLLDYAAAQRWGQRTNKKSV